MVHITFLRISGHTWKRSHQKLHREWED